VGNISLEGNAGRHYVYAVLSAIKGELSEQLLLPFVLLLLLQLFADVLERLLIEGTALACGDPKAPLSPPLSPNLSPPLLPLSFVGFVCA